MTTFLSKLWDWLMIFSYRFRVCWIGWTWHKIWVWNHINLDDWYEMKIGEKNPECAYIEGWCRE